MKNKTKSFGNLDEMTENIDLEKELKKSQEEKKKNEKKEKVKTSSKKEIKENDKISADIEEFKNYNPQPLDVKPDRKSVV